MGDLNSANQVGKVQLPTIPGKWFLFPFVKQVKKRSHSRSELENLRVHVSKDNVRGCAHEKGSKLVGVLYFGCYSPLQIWTTPMMMIRARARSFPAVKMS